MSFADDKRVLARLKDGSLAFDAPEVRALNRRSARAVDLQVDLVSQRLAAIPGPGAGFDTRRASDQRRYDETLAELEWWRNLQDSFVEIELRALEDDLTLSARRADEAALAFTRELEKFQ